MTITLTSDIESALAQYARKIGTTPELLALKVLEEQLLASPDALKVSPGDKGRTLFDFLGGHLGALSSSEFIPGGAQMSKNSGKKFSTLMEEKRQRGRL
ncbi:hypothetical protein KJ068_27415 [bacterium]|nr:hypothetical protein [bacterium]RIK61582.1 MAG: hypothetical protein DCC62_27530 [candidate division KSB1 bacterium]